VARAQHPQAGLPDRAAQSRDALERQHRAGGRGEAALDQPAQPVALLGILDPRVARLEVHGQPALGAQTVPRILVGERDVVGIDLEVARERARKARGVLGGVRAGPRDVGEQLRVAPDRHAVAAPPAGERPARQRLARVPLALTEVQHAAGRDPRGDPAQERLAEPPLVRPERGVRPLGSVHVVGGDERGLAAHREAHVAGAQVRVDALAELVDPRPRGVVVGLRHARRLAHALDAHRELELDLAIFDAAGDRRGGRGIGRGCERDVSFGGEHARGGIESDPARAR
jgi:hypothetical protein